MSSLSILKTVFILTISLGQVACLDGFKARLPSASEPASSATGPIEGSTQKSVTPNSQAVKGSNVKARTQTVRTSGKVYSVVSTPVSSTQVECIGCSLLDPSHDVISYEQAESCGPERTYLENDLSQVNALFRFPRKSYQGNSVPKACIQYAMEAFPNMESLYSKCEKIDSRPVSGAQKPCLTSRYVNSVYNSFVDVMSCLNIDQKIFVPKLLNESGFHINALNSRGFDAGVGQITRAPLEDINSNHRFKRLMGMIQNGQSEACQRIASVPGIFERAPVDANNRCSVIKPGINPLRNLVYTGLLTLRQKEIVEYYMEKHQIDRLMAAGGLKDYPREALVETLTVLAYNAGGGTAVNYLKNYLETRVKKMASSKRGPLSPSDFDFNADIESVLAQRSSLLSHFRKAKEEGHPNFANEGLRRIEKQAAQTGIENMSFPEFLVHFQTVGSRGYNSFLAQNKQKIDEKFRGGECTPEQFLSL